MSLKLFDTSTFERNKLIQKYSKNKRRSENDLRINDLIFYVMNLPYYNIKEG